LSESEEEITMLIAVILKANQPDVYKQLLKRLPKLKAKEIINIEYDPALEEDETKEFIYLRNLMQEKRGVAL